MVKKSALAALENKIPEVSGSGTTFALTAVENKIPYVSSLVRKTDYDTKISEIENKIPSITGLVTNSALTAVERNPLILLAW